MKLIKCGNSIEVIYSIELNDVDESVKSVKMDGATLSKQEYVPIYVVLRGFDAGSDKKWIHIFLGTTPNGYDIFSCRLAFSEQYKGYIPYSVIGKTLISQNKNLYLTYYCNEGFQDEPDHKPFKLKPLIIDILGYRI